MCGIAVLIAKDGGDRPPPAALDAMLDVLWHRGPDARGAWSEGPVALGHQRLAILDLSDAGRQPMRDDAASLVVAFNGEIYNHVELRRELEGRGVRFRTRTDTEVVLEAYRAWGEGCVTRFNGMWAFAIWDGARRRLFVSRDRLGIKPLYFYETPTCFALASEEKALLAAFPEARAPNEAMIRHFLPDGVLDDGPETFFARVEALPAATNATYTPGSTWRRERYWDIAEPSARAGAGDESIEALRALIASAVALQSRADVPVGTCLSGGVDSSTVVAAMARQGDRVVHTYSALFADAGIDESPWVDAVRQRYPSLTGASLRPEPRGDLLDDLATLCWFHDAPTGGAGVYTQFFVMKRASDDVKVVLDGQGGDELFGGYVHYYLARLRDLRAQGATGLARAALLAARLPLLFGQSHRRGILRTVAGDAAAHRLLGTSPAPPLFEDAFYERTARDRIVRDDGRQLASALDTRLYRDMTRAVLPALLRYEDRNSMASSVEARVPLLDHRIVELAFSLAPEQKIHGTWTKWALRKAAEPWLPAAVAWRRSKLGFATPFGRWLRSEPDRTAAYDLLFSERARTRGIVSGAALAHLWREHQTGLADHAWPLWRAMTLELWFRTFIDGWRPAEPTATRRRGHEPGSVGASRTS